MNRLPNLIDRVKHVSDRTKQHKDKDKAASHSPTEYAQHHIASTSGKMARTQIRMSAVAGKRVIRPFQKKWAISEDRVARQKPAVIISKPSARQLRIVRRLSLRKPEDGTYVLSANHPSGKQRFIQSRANARLLHPSRNSASDRLHRGGKHQEPAGKKGASTAAASRSATLRGDRSKASIFENMRKQPDRQPSARIPRTTSKRVDFTIKRKEWKFKTLSPFIKTGQRFGQATSRSGRQAEGKTNSDRSAQQAVQMAITARRSLQRAQAAARLNLRIIKMVVKAVALLVKGVAALLGISSTVIVLLSIVMAIAAVISSPFGLFVSSENGDAEVKPLAQIFQKLDMAYADRLAEVQRSADQVDRVKYHYPGSADNTRIDNWMDIIAVFAVKTVTDSENGMDVAILDATKVGIIKTVFWDMNQVESRLETLEHTGTVTVEHEDGSTSEETITSYEQFLHITHVGIYAGDGKVVDASSSRGQVVYRNLFDSDKQVLFGRPQIQGEN